MRLGYGWFLKIPWGVVYCRTPSGFNLLFVAPIPREHESTRSTLAENAMDSHQQPQLETDERFPSGPWTGYWLQNTHPGRNMMELRLTFQNGVMTGEGRDWIGDFLIRGRYDVADGKCHWTKHIIGKHDVFYQGYNEGKGIWGVWEIVFDGRQIDRDGFHIWPKGMGGMTDEHLTEAIPLPVADTELVEAR
jgi:hypothetical protein